jgi:drug/metabolite transporter (DMT)-like permease
VIVFAIVSALGFGLANGLAQRYIRDLGIIRTLFVRSAISALILSLLFVFWPHPLSFEGVVIASIVAVFGIIAVYAFYRALGIGVSGIVTPIANSAVIVTVVVAAIVFGEMLLALHYVLIGFIVLGVLALSHDGSHAAAKGIGFALLAMLCWGLSYAFLLIPTRLIGPIATPLVGEILVVLIAGSVLVRRFEPLPRSAILPLGAIGVSIVAGVAGFTFALASTPVSIVAAISASNPLVTALYMRIAHGEQLSLLQRAGSLIVVTGVVLLSFFS